MWDMLLRSPPPLKKYEWIYLQTKTFCLGHSSKLEIPFSKQIYNSEISYSLNFMLRLRKISFIAILWSLFKGISSIIVEEEELME